MKRMLINATQEEELRLAMVDGQRLYDLNIEVPASERKKANIYKGKITRIEPSLEAAFVDFGAERHGFLPLKEVSSEYFVKPVESGNKPNIREVLNEGQDIVVQIDKEERGSKGAALTTFVSLAGRFIVLKPNKVRSGGVSRRIVGADRDLARKSLGEIEVPDGMSVILRTAGIDRSAEELAWDLENLLTIWHAILNVVLERPSPFLIYRESNAVVRALRDYLTNEIGEILIDNEKTYKEAVEFVEQVMPHNLRKLKHYVDPVPLFTRFQIETQIESAFAHSVTLPSGGSIVIDHTEALVSIDINSARSTKGGDIEATALNTNLEAADEIARQLRIRDLGGLIVIDFIDMGPQKHQRQVESRLREAVRQDRARVQIGKITRFGLLEMSRQRLRPSLGESSYLTCPRCSGIGTIRSVESLALAILRIIGEEARKERTAKVIAQLPVEVATYLLNEKRDWVQSVETQHDTQVILVANSLLETPHYDVRRVRDDQTALPENVGLSYELADSEPEPELPAAMQERQVAEQAAIGVIKPSAPAPERKKKGKKKGKGFWAGLVAFFTGEGKKKQKKKSPAKRKRSPQKRDSRSRGQKARGARRADSKGGGNGRRTDQAAKRGGTRKKTGAKKKAQGTTAQRKDSPQQARQSKATAEASDTEKATSKKPTRSRRSRGGRRRKRGGDGPQQKQAATQDQKVQELPQGDSNAEQKPAKRSAQHNKQPGDATKRAVTDASTMPEARPDQLSSPESTTNKETSPAAAKQPARRRKAATTKSAEPDSASSAESGPPRVRTDAQHVAEGNAAPGLADTRTNPAVQKLSDDKPAIKQKDTVDTSSNTSINATPEPKPEGRLLPWEPAEPPVVPKPAGKKPETPPAGD